VQISRRWQGVCEFKWHTAHLCGKEYVVCAAVPVPEVRERRRLAQIIHERVEVVLRLPLQR
jgi:hypothetical protein